MSTDIVYSVYLTVESWNGKILVDKATPLGTSKQVWNADRGCYTIGPLWVGKDCALTLEAALQLAEAKRCRKIHELEQELERVKTMKFTLVESLNA